MQEDVEAIGYIYVDLLALAISVALVVSSMRLGADNRAEKAYRVVAYLVILTVFIDIVLSAAQETFSNMAGAPQVSLLLVYYILALAMGYAWLCYIAITSRADNEPIGRPFLLGIALPGCLVAIVFTATAAMGSLNDRFIGTGNPTMLGVLFALALTFYMLASSIIAFYHWARAQESGRKRLYKWLSVSTLPLVASLFAEIFLIPLNITWGCAALALLINFVFVQQDVLSRSIAEAEQKKIDEATASAQLREARVGLATSQMKPHFIYNALNAISYLCQTDPEKAKVAVGNFERYLSENIEAMSDPAPIPVEQEIAHVRDYIDIELLRFPDMSVRYDIGPTGFVLPPLSVQPLAENAVRHGIRARADAGTIIISTWEDHETWNVSVDDDGPGFKAPAKQEGRSEDGEERGHTGVANVRERIETIVCGTLTVEKSPLGGARVTIHIPKERAS